MNRKIGSLRHPSSGPCPLRTTSALSPSSTVLDADSASRAYDTLWKYHSIEAEADLTGQHMDRPPIIAAPKLVLRPLAKIVGGLEPHYLLQNSEEKYERQLLHTADIARSYGAAGSAHDAGVLHDHDPEWGTDRKPAHNTTKPVSAASRRALGHVPNVGAPTQNMYDIGPYDNVDPLSLPVRCGPPAAATLFQQRMAGMGICMKPSQPPVPRRPLYGQRVLLQRLPAPLEADVSYLHALPYVDTYAMDCNGDNSGHPIEPRPPPHAPQLPYSFFQDVVHQCPYEGRHATSNGCSVSDTISQEELLLQRQLISRAQTARHNAQYGWTSETMAEAPEDETAMVAHVIRTMPGGGLAQKEEAKVPMEAVADDSEGEGPPEAFTLCNLAALAEVACRAAELLDKEGEEQAEMGDDQAGETGEAAEVGSIDSGNSRKGIREVEGRGRGKRRTAAAAAAMLAAPPPVTRRQQQLNQQKAWAASQEHRHATSAAAAAAAAAALPAAAAAAAGSAGPPALELPLTVFHLDRKCPKVLAPRSGRLGDTKHLVLPGEIVQSLPRDVCSGERPILVQALAPITTAAPTNIDAQQQQHQHQHQHQQSQPQQLLQRCDIKCQIGNGPGGFPALHLPVSEAVYGRPVRRFTLREDMVLELELGDPVVRPSKSGRKRGADSSSSDDDGDDKEADEEEEEEEGGPDGDDEDGTPGNGGIANADAAAAAATAAAGSPMEVCSFPLCNPFEICGGLREQVGKGEADWTASAGVALIRTPDAAGTRGEEERVAGTGSGSNVSEDTGVAVLGGVASLSAAAIALETTEPTQPGTTTGGGGGRRRCGMTAATLPIIVRRPASSKPTVIRSCTGAVGSKKHLPLPNIIVKALPHPQRSGSAPVEVMISYVEKATGNEAAAPQPEECLSCFVGPTGSHGCTALQVPVSRGMNGRRLLHIALRADLKIELGLGERVDTQVETATAQGRGRAAGAGAGAAQSGDTDAEDDDDDAVAENVEGSTVVQRRQRGGGGDAALEKSYSMPGQRYKRRRSSSGSPCDSAGVGETAAIAVAAGMYSRPPPSLGPEGGCKPVGTLNGGTLRDGRTEFPDQDDAYKELAAMAARAGLSMEAVEALRQQLMVQQQHGHNIAHTMPPPPIPQLQLHLQPLQRRWLRPGTSTVSTVVATPGRHRTHYSPSGLPPYGMLSYIHTATATAQPVNFAALEAMAPAVRQMAPLPASRSQRASGPYGRSARQLHLLHDALPAHIKDLVDPSSPTSATAAKVAAVNTAPVVEDESAANAALGRAWVLLQQVPRVQLAAARTLAAAAAAAAAAASTQNDGAAGPEAGTVLSNFRACLTGILGLLMRAREAAVADLAAQLDASGGGGSVGATGSVYNDLLVAAPAMLNAAECLLEWYGLLAGAEDERTAVAYATELAGSAALVKAQLAHDLAPLAVLVRV